MVILIIMGIGVLIGFKWFPESLQKINSQLQVVSIIALIFCMGISLGSNPSFIQDLMMLGYKSLVYAIFPIIGSVGMVYLLSRKFLK